jgi:molecular chaperone DnaJ
VVDEKCPECRGTGGVTKTRTLNVRIPAGVADGQRIRLAGRGEPGERGGDPGDLHLLVKVRPDAIFGREGDDLTLTVPITYAEAVFGTDLRVPTLDGAVTLRVTPGTPSGRTLRVRGRGVPRRDGTQGDLLVLLEVDVPAHLSPEARKALEEYALHAPPSTRGVIDDAVRRNEFRASSRPDFGG